MHGHASQLAQQHVASEPRQLCTTCAHELQTSRHNECNTARKLAGCMHRTQPHRCTVTVSTTRVPRSTKSSCYRYLCHARNVLLPVTQSCGHQQQSIAAERSTCNPLLRGPVPGFTLHSWPRPELAPVTSTQLRQRHCRQRPRRRAHRVRCLQLCKAMLHARHQPTPARDSQGI
jgi:hypothetical protein